MTRAFQGLSEKVRTQAKNGRPDDTAGRIEEQESVPLHEVNAGEEGGHGTQHGHEPAEEDNFAAVPGEQELAEPDAARIDSDEAAVPLQQRVTEPPADQV